MINWNFDNTYLKLPRVFYSSVRPNKFEDTKLVLFNNELSKKLDLNIGNIENSDLSLELSGQVNKKNKYKFFSQAYAGHQFGQFTILGDGRALLLGEHLNNKKSRFDIQLKGSGLTPYSRNGDGKATLGSMIREYIVSEAMYNLNIPSTRSLAVIKTGEKVFRDKYENGALLVRVAKSHIRVGTFQFATILKEKKCIKEIINYTIKRLIPELEFDHNKYLKFFEHITKEQIKLVIEWMRVGFIHGVMNTDNMSLSGETIDYGPCAFLDEYNPNKVFSSIDRNGRYSFQNQRRIVFWNLARLVETFLHLIDRDEKKSIKIVENILLKYQKIFYSSWLNMMRNKLNLRNKNEKDHELISELLDTMHIFKLDYTNTFINLQNNNLNNIKYLEKWLTKYNDRKKIEKSTATENIFNVNPYLIPRNHLIDRYIKEAESENYKNLENFIYYLKNPYVKNSFPQEYINMPNEEEKVYQTFCGT